MKALAVLLLLGLLSAGCSTSRPELGDEGYDGPQTFPGTTNEIPAASW